jgi:hypothetical protein
MGFLLGSNLSAQSTAPASYTSIVETPVRGDAAALLRVMGEVSDQSGIAINFDETKMMPPDATGARMVQIRVEAELIKGATRTQVVPIDNYASKRDDNSQVVVVRHDKPYDPAAGFKEVPDTFIYLPSLDINNYDAIMIRVTNVQTQEAIERYLTPRPFGFRVNTSDSLLFVRRRGVTSEEESEGIEDFNFGPTPGVTYGGIYLPRKNGFLRFLRPGVGINLSFMDWDDSTFDPATGQFATGTDSNDIEIGLGVQVSLFSNILQLSYGWNLQAEQDRQYFGVGVSFVNLANRLTGLIARGAGSGTE